MKKNNIPEAIGVIVSLGGIVVMAGWLLGIEALKSILPVWVTMKFPTAFSFLLCGIELYFIARFQKKDRELPVIVIPIISMAIFLLMASMIASTIIGVSVGVEEMFVKESINIVKSVTPGRPSVATMFNFIIMAMSGILTTINVKRLSGAPVIFAAIIIVIGSMAVLGYAINQPLLYFAVPGKSSAMALHTAILFVLWGLGSALIEKSK
jgi:uncharacterized protein with PQ loop repeat